MSKAKLGDPTDFSYRVNKVIKVVDGDTIDVMLDLGFDIMYKSRVRLFGIDTPESRTSDKVEKKYGMLSKKFLSPVFCSLIILTLSKWCVNDDSKDKSSSNLSD